ncbi:MAG: undecaprenyl/decaprenyl-phosphate alpha-N-acetylglucosaminyl 1-phosphate transferase [Bacteroidetes bacterium]|nr:undecaprenyl/decaprenyl-phosphate alpha-N-acetylglucosaminyl 1-phosphate transferase [Bacteroidota bacterium]
MNTLLLAFFTAFGIVLFSIPSLIKVAELKNLFDDPEEFRKHHKHKTPTMGGIMIYAGTLFSWSLWFPSHTIIIYNFIIATSLVLFFVGVKDDIFGTAAIKKLLAHLLVAMILVLMANVRITSLHGILGVNEIPEWASIFLSIFTIIVIVNSFNLIDGVDGLAGSIGFVGALSFGTWFHVAGDHSMAVLAIALAGGLLGFLWFNFSPAKIFMGDSGSLVIGMFFAVMSIRLIEFDQSKLFSPLSEISRPVFAIAVLIFPLFDTLRVFIIRIAKGISPFTADRNHLHHRLLDLGFNHRQTVFALVAVNALIISLAVYTRTYGANTSFTVVMLTAFLLFVIPLMFKPKKN